MAAGVAAVVVDAADAPRAIAIATDPRPLAPESVFSEPRPVPVRAGPHAAGAILLRSWPSISPTCDPTGAPQRPLVELGLLRSPEVDTFRRAS